MDKRQASRRAKELRSQLQVHNYLYHVQQSPVISDGEFDRLLNELRSIEADFPDLITEDLPTRKVGGQVAEKFARIRHPAPILSLGNTFSPDDIRAWHARITRLDPRAAQAEFVVEPKLDGLTVVLHYVGESSNSAQPGATARWGRTSPAT